MDKTITFTLNKHSIKKAIKSLEGYDKYVQRKAVELQKAIAQVGYDCAERNVDGFNGIVFEIRNHRGYTSLVGFSNRQLRTWWNKKEGQVISKNYSPILMAEYGSGVYADDEHRGTFPNKTGRESHGLKNVWAWRDKMGSDLSFTEGERPTKPMQKAYKEMADELAEVARRVFSED